MARSDEDTTGRIPDRRNPAGRPPPLAGYANYFEVGHNAFEFLLDAGQVEPQSGDIRFTDRIAISPVHAKLLGELLARSINQFETLHGPIPSLVDDDEEALALTCPEDFERRALDARRRAASCSGDASASSTCGHPISQER
ncbi:MAG TPA: DUF3467 domain-containing protein [Novosphingobium sp.]|nr:DUF3467 domain-containing protein [Novosphingobium sp.]